MRWATYRSLRSGAELTGLLHDGKLYAEPPGIELIDLIGAPGGLENARRRVLDSAYEITPLSEADLLAPVPRPPSVRDFMSFADHYVDTREAAGLAVEPLFYEQPCFYFSNPAAITAPDAEIPMAPGTARFDFELEVAAIVGAPGRDLSPSEAENHIAGYCILCDWSARDLQIQELVFGNGPAKGKDTATSLGPYLVTPDELAPYRSGRGFDLAMTATVNGVQYSDGNWKSTYWSIAECLAYASRGTEVRPGDVIGLGTVGTGSIIELSSVHGPDDYPWLRPGDEVVLTVGALGQVRGLITPPAAEPRSLRADPAGASRTVDAGQ